MGWVVMLAGLAMLYVFNKRVNPKRMGRDVIAIITMMLAAIAGCGMAFTFLGRWLAGLISMVGGMLAKLAHEPFVALGVSIAITIVMVGVAVADISFDRKADKGAQFAAIVMPTLLALVIGGSLGQSGGSAVQSVNTKVSSFVTQQFGGS